MQCPTDGATLVMSERSGIEIDYCPTCRGVWLDRGELDKIIERSMTQAPPAPAAPQQQRYDDRDRSYDRDRSSGQQGYGQQPYRKKKKESWLSELFD
ncbi:TFIIB-type zinc ribbon-containing protein [Nocardioides jensenii]|uniref:TFIIB-type zinc ribbon-containing protein n=1 Tax=Nocardioides jensenii TaxID=1843 RepID=UPI00082CF9F1|nr:zf-TFIIB domain-containing protein [Nocardioides jensenii]